MMPTFNDLLEARESAFAARSSLRAILQEFSEYRKSVDALIGKQENCRELRKAMPIDDLQVLQDASYSADRLTGVTSVLSAAMIGK